MMNFLFDEQFAIENMIKMRVVDNDNVFSTIKDIARYNYWVKNMDDDSNYIDILRYLQQNGKNINEESVYMIIDDCVKKSRKYQFKHVDEVCITKSELQFIGSLENIKQEKVAFVLLAVAKYYDVIRGTQFHTAYMRNADICKLARVTIPVKDRDVFMQFAYDCNILSRHNRAGSIEKKVLIVSSDDDDDVVLRLKENDFKDLAYTYLAYKTPHNFRRCIVCKRWMKKDSKDRQVCDVCSKKNDMYMSMYKMIECKDCGKSVYISIHNKRTIRCDDCQKNAIIEQKAKWWSKNNDN